MKNKSDILRKSVTNKSLILPHRSEIIKKHKN